MLALEIAVIRFPLPGENRQADFACQIREVMDRGDGTFSYGEPKTLEPARLAEIGVTLETVLTKGNVEFLKRAVEAETALESERQKHADAIEAKNAELAQAVALTKTQAKHIATLTKAEG